MSVCYATMRDNTFDSDVLLARAQGQAKTCQLKAFKELCSGLLSTGWPRLGLNVFVSLEATCSLRTSCRGDAYDRRRELAKCSQLNCSKIDPFKRCVVIPFQSDQESANMYTSFRCQIHVKSYVDDHDGDGQRRLRRRTGCL